MVTRMFDSAAPILPVTDVRRALRHYAALGFTVSEYDDDAAEQVYYGFAERDAVHLHFSLVEDHDPLKTASAVYFYVADADALYSEWRQADVGGRLIEPEDSDYGLREGAHIDEDGNLIRFGSPLVEELW